jgi:Sodium:sulfate symporter transmembrane region.
MLGFSNQTIADLLYWITRKRWLIAAFAISLFLFYIPSPSSISPQGHRTLIIVVIALILIIGEVIPLPAVAILIFDFGSHIWKLIHLTEVQNHL